VSRQRTKRTTTFLAVAALAMACGHVAAPPSGAAEETSSEKADLARRMAAIQRSLSAVGYAPLPARVFAEIAEGGSCALELTPGAGRVVAVAIGAPDALSMDLAVTAEGDGEELASDVSRARRAAVSFAARADTPYTITATAVAGSGTAAVAVFGAALSATPPPLATLFDADPAPRLSWAEIENLLRADGYEPEGEPVDFDSAEAAHRSFPFGIRAGRCYSFVALGSGGVDAIELRVSVFAELLSADLAERYHAWAQLCAEEDATVRASIDVSKGAGHARLGLFAAPRDAVADLNGPRIRPAVRVRTLDAALRSAGAVVERRGYGPAERLTTAVIEGAGGRVEVPLPSEPSGCYALVAAAEDAGADVDLQIVLERRSDAKQALELTDPSDGPDSRIAVCHGDDVRASATLIAVRGGGPVGVAKHVLPDIAIEAGGKEPPLAAREAAARLGRVGLAPAGSGPSVRSKGGLCYGAIAFSPGGRISRLAARERGAGDHATEWSGDDEGPEVTWCAEEDADYDVEATAIGEGAGPPVIVVFAADR
jgi:hypothetical protein